MPSTPRDPSTGIVSMMTEERQFSPPPGFSQRITESSLNYLAAAPAHMNMPDIESL